MAKYFGDLPCANIEGTVHITVSATKLLCGRDWRYRPAWSQNFGRVLKNTNIIYREIDAVTCPECQVAYAASRDESLTSNQKLCVNEECEPPFGGKEACEFYQNGACTASR